MKIMVLCACDEMKLKYQDKKWIFYASTLIWGISLLHLSFTPISSASVAITPTPIQTPPPTTKIEPTPTSTPIPTATPTPTPIPKAITAKLIQTTDINIIDTISFYLHAKYENDTNTLKTMVTDVSKLNTEQTETDSTNVSSISNLVCYIKPGSNEIDTIVYACFDIKYKSSSVSVP